MVLVPIADPLALLERAGGLWIDAPAKRLWVPRLRLWLGMFSPHGMDRAGCD